MAHGNIIVALLQYEKFLKLPPDVTIGRYTIAHLPGARPALIYGVLPRGWAGDWSDFVADLEDLHARGIICWYGTDNDGPIVLTPYGRHLALDRARMRLHTTAPLVSD
jgi:hypothetical protein